MSFAQDIKKELCALYIKKPCCRKALLLGILRASYIFCEREIHFTTRSRTAAALAVALLSDVFGISAILSGDMMECGDESAEGSYQLRLTDDAAEIIAEQFPLRDSGFRGAVPDMLQAGCISCAVHYLRGVFLSCGTVTDPRSSYHLDMVLPEDAMAEEFGMFLGPLGFLPKHTARKGMPVLYWKDSAVIEDFLATIGAQKAVFSLMNTKIEKEIRNAANRISNCELANIDKTVSASALQYEAIRKLYKEERFHLLSVELQQTARLRYEHPELPLKDLAALHEPPLTKSGLNHRLKRIVEFSKVE